MENSRYSKAPMIPPTDFNLPSRIRSPMNLQNFIHARPYIPLPNPYAYYSHRPNSPYHQMNYMSSDTPPAAAGSSAVLHMPLKIEEDVIVMDAIPVQRSRRGSREVGPRSSQSPSQPGTGVFMSNSISNPTMPSSSAGGNKVSVSQPRGSSYYGSNFQFAPRMAEPHPPYAPGIIRPQITTPYNSEGSSSRYFNDNQSAPQAFSSSARPRAPSPSPKAIRQYPEQPSSRTTSISRSISCSRPLESDWCPLDDKIEIPIPTMDGGKPSRDAVDAYIREVLYRPSSTRRLPEFVKIAPD